MHMLFKLIALSVVFGLTIANPAAKLTPLSYDDLVYESPFETFEVFENDNDDSHTVDLAVAKPALVAKAAASVVFKTISKLVSFKYKALAIVIVALKWLVSKVFVLAIGSIATLAFCKWTSKCNFAQNPVIYLIPAQATNFVTTKGLQDAQQLLSSAVQQYQQDNLPSEN